jgi:beta-glucosidase
MHNNFKFLYLFLYFIFINQTTFPSKPPLSFSHDELRWDWSKIEPIKIEDLKFPEKFIWGVATSAHQVEGNCNCQWIDFEKKKNLEQSANACEHITRYKEDIKLIKNLGVHAYRFSIEWSKIEPKEGQFNQEAINHYHNLIDNLIANNIIPVITLHHFTHPVWFEDKKGFEREENIKYFVRFSQKMFNEYSAKVPMWCTLNEPGVFAFQGYFRGAFPPGKIDMQLCGEVSKNLIIAHINVYKALKAMQNGRQCQIGITHSITQYNAYHTGSKFNPMQKFEEFLSHYLNHSFYDAMMNFFITGKFEYKVPGVIQLILTGKPTISCQRSLLPIKMKMYGQVKYEYADANNKYNPKDILDFFGIQPYSNVLVDCTNTDPVKKPALRTGDIATDMPYRICAESLYRAVHQASFIGVPIFVTENGIADAKDDRRELFIRRYIYALHKAIQDGYDVRGYFYWSLMDNFEWDLGYGMKFGLYEVDFKTQERKLRKGAEFYKNLVNHHNSTHDPILLPFAI